MASTLTFSTPAASGPSRVASRPSLFRRVLDAVIETRMATADRIVREHLARREARLNG